MRLILASRKCIDRTLDIGFDLGVIEGELADMANKPSPLVDLADAA